MNKPITIFLKRFGWFSFIRLFFYPLTALLTTPIRLLQTLWNCRILANGKWGEYHHFNSWSGLDYLFYWSLALNLYRVGRNGCSPYVGLGDYRLSRCFHYSLVSLYAYWGASTITLLGGMLGWFLVHLIWINHASLSWVILVMFFAIISTTFYANTFVLQNYNVLGWIFFPLGLYGILTGNWIIAAAAWFFASFCSFTVIFIAGIISIVIAITNQTLAPVSALLPAAFKLSLHVYPLLVDKNIKTPFLNVMKAIGMYTRDVKYKYTYPLKTKLITLYFLFLYGQFLYIAYLVKGEFSVVFFSGLAIFLLNSSFMRFADEQSMQMLMFSLATALVLKTQDTRILLSYWITISPLPLLIPFPFMKKVLDVVPKLAPFSIRKLMENMENFLASIKPGERIFMAFDDPKGKVANIFDGYKVLLDLPLYVTVRKGIHFMPNWWAVRDLNYEGATGFWGRDLESVLKNIRIWKADYVIVYQDAATNLDLKWEVVGFKVLNKFSWAQSEGELRGIKPYLGQTPDWYLMKIPFQNKEDVKQI